jgi:hypothetical protein
MKNGLIVEYRIKKYYLNDKYHREDGPAIEHASGDKSYYINGELHREDGPARDWSKVKEWWKNNQLHKEDGPAVIFLNGDKFYYLNDQEYSEEKYWKEIKKRKSLKFILDNLKKI